MEIIDEIDGEWVWLEEYWISQFITWGYNLTNGTSGGENPSSWKGKTHSDEYKEIRRKIMLENNPTKNMTQQWRDNISIAHKKNKLLPLKAIEIRKIKVYQFTLSGNFIREWGSLTEAAIGVGLKNGSGISAVCGGNRFKSGGFRWSYEHDKLFDFKFKQKGGKGFNKKAIEKAKEINKIKINQYTLKGEYIKTWDSISSAAIAIGVKNSSGIIAVCKNRNFMCGGFRWSYMGETLKTYKLTIGKTVKQLNLNGDLLRIWESTGEIKNELGFNPNCIAKACSGGLKTYRKYKWVWEDFKNIY